MIESPSPDTYFNEIDFKKLYSQRGKTGGPTWKFGTSKRKKEESVVKNSPGPGQYILPTTVGNVPHYDRARAKLIQIS